MHNLNSQNGIKPLHKERAEIIKRLGIYCLWPTVFALVILVSGELRGKHVAPTASLQNAVSREPAEFSPKRWNEIAYHVRWTVAPMLISVEESEHCHPSLEKILDSHRQYLGAENAEDYVRDILTLACAIPRQCDLRIGEQSDPFESAIVDRGGVLSQRSTELFETLHLLKEELASYFYGQKFDLHAVEYLHYLHQKYGDLAIYSCAKWYIMKQSEWLVLLQDVRFPKVIVLDAMIYAHISDEAVYQHVLRLARTMEEVQITCQATTVLPFVTEKPLEEVVIDIQSIPPPETRIPFTGITISSNKSRIIRSCRSNTVREVQERCVLLKAKLADEE